jgi:hypothetical protein
MLVHLHFAEGENSVQTAMRQKTAQADLPGPKGMPALQFRQSAPSNQRELDPNHVTEEFLAAKEPQYH